MCHLYHVWFKDRILAGVSFNAFISVAEHFGELHRVTLLRNQSLYTLPVGEIRPYFSFDRLARRDDVVLNTKALL